MSILSSIAHDKSPDEYFIARSIHIRNLHKIFFIFEDCTTRIFFAATIGVESFAVDGFNTHHKFSRLFRRPQVVINAETPSITGVKSIVTRNFCLGLFALPRIASTSLALSIENELRRTWSLTCKRDEQCLLEICISFNIEILMDDVTAMIDNYDTVLISLVIIRNFFFSPYHPRWRKPRLNRDRGGFGVRVCRKNFPIKHLKGFFESRAPD